MCFDVFRSSNVEFSALLSFLKVDFFHFPSLSWLQTSQIENDSERPFSYFLTESFTYSVLASVI